MPTQASALIDIDSVADATDLWAPFALYMANWVEAVGGATEWDTSVFQAKSLAEKRFGHVGRPTLSISVLLNAKGVRENWTLFNTLMRMGIARSLFPVYQDMSVVTQASSLTTIHCDTTNRRFSVGARILIARPWKSPQMLDFSYGIIASLSDTAIELTGNIPHGTWEAGCRVYPAIEADVNLTASLEPQSPRWSDCRITAVERTGAETHVALTGYEPTEYEDLPIFSPPNMWSTPIRVGIARDGVKTASGSSNMPRLKGTRPRLGFSGTSRVRGRDAAFDVLRFFDDRRGRLKPFIAVHPISILRLVSIESSTEVVFDAPGPLSLWDSYEYISFKRGGESLVRRIASVSLDIDENSVVILEDALPSTIASEYTAWSVAYKARFSNDRMTESWLNGRTADISIDVEELIEEKDKELSTAPCLPGQAACEPTIPECPSGSCCARYLFTVSGTNSEDANRDHLVEDLNEDKQYNGTGSELVCAGGIWKFRYTDGDGLILLLEHIPTEGAPCPSTDSADWTVIRNDFGGDPTVVIAEDCQCCPDCKNCGDCFFNASEFSDLSAVTVVVEWEITGTSGSGEHVRPDLLSSANAATPLHLEMTLSATNGNTLYEFDAGHSVGVGMWDPHNHAEYDCETGMWKFVVSNEDESAKWVFDGVETSGNCLGEANLVLNEGESTSFAVVGGTGTASLSLGRNHSQQNPAIDCAVVEICPNRPPGASSELLHEEIYHVTGQLYACSYAEGELTLVGDIDFDVIITPGGLGLSNTWQAPSLGIGLGTQIGIGVDEEPIVVNSANLVLVNDEDGCRWQLGIDEGPIGCAGRWIYNKYFGDTPVGGESDYVPIGTPCAPGSICSYGYSNSITGLQIA